MRVSVTKTIVGGLALLGMLVSGQAAQRLQAYPSREVQIVVPNEPGGGLDLVARQLAKDLSSRLGQAFIVINRSGASGNIGTSSVARAKPDGYTVLLTGVGHLASPLLHERAGYAPLKDFKPIAKIANAPNVLLVHVSIKHLSLTQLLADPRSQSGELPFASAGYGTSSHLSAEIFMERTGARWLHVPFRGTGPATKALISGEVLAMFVPAGSVQALLATGRVHAVAVAAAKRLDTLATIATLAELGVNGAEFSQWYGVFAPVGTPAPIVDALQNAVLGFASKPESTRLLRALGLDAAPMASALFTEFLDYQSVMLNKLVKQLSPERVTK